VTYFQRKSKNKFNAKSTTYNDQFFHSKGEAGYCMELDWRIKAGEIQSYERQVKIDLTVNGVHITNYFVDFRVINKHGGVEYHEYKGMVLGEFMIKWRLFQALIDEIDPGAELILIKHQQFRKKK
jgi:hypothetical protein